MSVDQQLFLGKSPHLFLLIMTRDRFVPYLSTLYIGLVLRNIAGSTFAVFVAIVSATKLAFCAARIEMRYP